LVLQVHLDTRRRANGTALFELRWKKRMVVDTQPACSVKVLIGSTPFAMVRLPSLLLSVKAD
jgi:hypothetical protein